MEIIDVNFNFDGLKEVVHQRIDNFTKLSEQWKAELEEHIKVATLALSHDAYKKRAAASFYKAQQTEEKVKYELSEAIKCIDMLLLTMSERLKYSRENPSIDQQTAAGRIGEGLMLDDDIKYYQELKCKCEHNMAILNEATRETYEKESGKEKDI